MGHTYFGTFEFANSTRPIFETSLFEISGCNYR
jgi:hypothetical protein